MFKHKFGMMSLMKIEPIPLFCGYQLLGDSNIVRFCVSELKMKANKDENGKAYIGISVSGQRIHDLRRLIEQNLHVLSEKVIILIGTNDVLKKTTFEKFRFELRKIRNILRVRDINCVFLTIPPVVRFWKDNSYRERTILFNTEIKSIQDSKCRVLDLYERLLDHQRDPRENYYEQFFGSPTESSPKRSPRVDLIHFNSTGFKMISYWLKRGLDTCEEFNVLN